MQPNDTQYYPGGAVKAVGERRFGGYLVRFNTDTADLHGERFTPETDFLMSSYKIIGQPVLFHHGLDEDIGVIPIGVCDYAERRDDGIYIECKLDFAGNYKAYAAGLGRPADWVKLQEQLASEYEQYIWQWMQQGKTGFSSGALPQSVEVDSTTKTILRWAIIEPTVTRTEADPRRMVDELGGRSANTGTEIYTIRSLSPLKAFSDLVKESMLTKEPVGNAESDKKNVEVEIEVKPTGDSSTMTPEEFLALLRQALPTALGELGIAPASPEAAQMESTMETVAAAMEPPVPGEDPTAKLTAALQKTVEQTVQRQNAIKSAAKAAVVAGVQNAAIGQPNTTGARAQAGAYHNPTDTQSNTAPAYIRNMRLKSKYSNVSPETFSFAMDVQNARNHQKGLPPFLPGGSMETYQEVLRTYADNLVQQHNEKKFYGDVEHVAKAMEFHSMKSDELDYTTQANYGADWVWTNWRNQLIEKARRENVIMPLFNTITMTAKTETHPVEWNDPTAYYVTESVDDADLIITGSNIPSSKVGTEDLTMTARKMGVRTGWSSEQDEDSIIRYADQAQRQVDRVLRNGLDRTLAYGDTVTTTANMNYAGGSPTGNEVWLSGNGLAKLAIVTNTALGKDAGGAAVNLSLIREARFKLGGEFNTEVDNIVMITNASVYRTLLEMDEFITMDKAGPNATAQKGQIGYVDGIPVLVSSQVPLSYTAGKVSSTSNQNTLGVILFMYKPYWYLGMRRNITSKIVESEDGEAYSVIATTRIAVATNPENTGASILYNLAV